MYSNTPSSSCKEQDMSPINTFCWVAINDQVEFTHKNETIRIPIQFMDYWFEVNAALDDPTPFQIAQVIFLISRNISTDDVEMMLSLGGTSQKNCIALLVDKYSQNEQVSIHA